MVIDQEAIDAYNAPIPAPVDPRAALDAYNAQQAPAPMTMRNFGQQQMQSIDTLATDRTAALQVQTQAAQQAESERARLAEERAAQARAAGVDAAMTHESYKMDRDDVRAEYDRMQQQIANTRIEDTQSKVMGALAIGLSGPAHFKDTIAQLDKQTDRKLQIQRDNLNNQKDVAQMQLNELNMARQFFHDDNQAAEFIRAADREAYGAELERIAAQLGSQTAQAQALDLAAMIKADAVAKKAGLFAQRAAAQARRGPRQLTAKDMLDLESKALDIEKKRRDLEGGDGATGQEVPGGLIVQNPRVYGMLTQVQRQKVQDSPAAAEKLISLIDEIEKVRAEHPYSRGIPWTEGNEKLSGYQGQITGAVKEAEQLGALDNGVIALVKQVAGDATAIRDAPAVKLRQLRQVVADNARKKLEASGVSVAPNTPYQAMQRAMAEGGDQGGGPSLSTPENQAKINALKTQFSFRPAGQ
jgi:hypothetical protein